MPAAGVDGGSGIILDDREESRLLIELERFSIPVCTMRLESKDSAGRNVSMGDAVFAGHGPSGPVQVAFERKKLDDLVTCIKDRRLSAQLRDMREICQYDRIYVVIEGIWKPSAQGTIEVMNGGGTWRPFYSRQSKDAITYAQVDGYLESLSECGGVRVVRTGSVQETAHLYVSRYNQWNRLYESRGKSVVSIYSRDPDSQRRGKAVLHQGTPGPVCQFAAQLPGVDAKSWSVAEQYGSVHELVTGHPMTDYEFRESVNRWMGTTWTDSGGKIKRFGRKTATEIVSWLRRSK